MKKLEEIPKKEVFKVPDGYFDQLPSVIQSRIAEKGNRLAYPSFQVAWKYALPAIVLFAVGIFWFARPEKAEGTEMILATVQTEDLVAYLNESDITTEEVVEAAEFNTEDLDEIEGEVYLDRLDLDKSELEEIERLINEGDGNNL